MLKLVDLDEKSRANCILYVITFIFVASAWILIANGTNCDVTTVYIRSSQQISQIISPPRRPANDLSDISCQKNETICDL